MKKHRTFWPLPGGVRNYATTLYRILTVINEKHPTPELAIKWITNEYDVKENTAKSYFNVVIKRLRLFSTKNNRLYLNDLGKNILETKDNSLILQILLEDIFGFRGILMLLGDENTLEMNQIWKKMEKKYQIGWKRNAQIRWRVYWLLSLGYVEVTAKQYYLTEKGIAALTKLKKEEIIKKSPKTKGKKELEELSHSDIEDKMKYVGEFFEFESIKRPQINEMLPEERKLKSSRKELDGLWIKKIPMGGKIYYPIEVQMGGNLSDTIDRLETVSDFAQKVIVVIDEKQEEIMLERLKAKRSKLLDKVVFIRPDDVYKLVSATNALKGFFENLFF